VNGPKLSAGALALALFLPAAASANLVQRGNLFVTFEGGISPSSLPRRALAPISVGIEGKIRGLSDASPPALRRIEIKLNRSGRLDTRDLPVCSPRAALGFADGRTLSPALTRSCEVRK
jgi:hypothetical protein